MTRRRAYAYITNRNRLLLFTQPGFPEAGIQVPAGTMHPGEEPEAAVMREAREETGLTDLELVRCLGGFESDMTEFGVSEVQEAWFFHLKCPGDPPVTWHHGEISAGRIEPIRFEFFWADLPDGVPQLIALNGAMLDVLKKDMNARGR